MERKMIVTRNYYPRYYGKRSSRYAYRSYYVGIPRPHTCDAVVGTCDAVVPDGWVPGVNGAIAARTHDAVTRLPGYRPVDIPPGFYQCPECGREIDGIHQYTRVYDGAVVNVCARCGAEWVSA